LEGAIIFFTGLLPCSNFLESHKDGFKVDFCAFFQLLDDFLPLDS